MSRILAAITALALVALLIWGSYWITKKLSYDWWYRDMVEQTVREMVKPEALR